MPTGIYIRTKKRSWKLSDETRLKMRKPKPWLQGRKLLEGHKRSISKTMKGRVSSVKGKHWKLSEESKKKISEARQGKSSGMLGKKHPIEARKKMGEAKKGNRNSLWKGGVTPENVKIRHSIEYRLWREAVFARDGWICQRCSKRGGRLHSHHALNFADYSELRFAIDNGITFCKKCHKEFHKRYGIKHNTKEQLKEFLC